MYVCSCRSLIVCLCECSRYGECYFPFFQEKLNIRNTFQDLTSCPGLYVVVFISSRDYIIVVIYIYCFSETS